MKFLGYVRPDGRVGTRNHVLIFPTVICATAVAQMIQREVPGTVTVDHPHGCGHMGEEKDLIVRAMAGVCSHPNVGGVLLVGLGCELITPEVVSGAMLANRRCELLSIQAEGGTRGAVQKGKDLAARLVAEIAQDEREPTDISALIVGTNCGGSDTLSGLTANPAVGAAADRIVAGGGTVILSETPELIGAEHVLSRRAASAEVRRRIYEITAATEELAMKAGVDIRNSEPSPGNKAGGLTTLEEKSLGAILKGGTSPIRQVISYAERPIESGLVIMDSPAHDAVCNTGMIAGGAQIIVFTTGRGTPLGAPTAPVVKVSSNSGLYRRMVDNLDVNAGSVLEGTETVDELGERLFREIVSVASGRLTKAELLGHNEFAIHSLGLNV
ncbi:MAG: UxaA family hydrolase [Actinobacteria bacterium]|nr:UxaA family hydrolase [Actinomycetota bacterium]